MRTIISENTFLRFVEPVIITFLIYDVFVGVCKKLLH